MTSFKDREKAFENKFVYDEEFKFKVNAKTFHLLGMWAAEELKIPEKEKYASELLAESLNISDEELKFKKILSEFEKGGVDINQEKIERVFFDFKKTVEQEVKSN